MKQFIAILVVAVALLSCSTIQPNSPAAIGLVNLSHYAVKDSSSLAPGDHFEAITNENDFYNRFTATTAGEEIKTPGFNGQIVLAITLKPSDRKTAVQFERAEIAGKDLNAYYTIREDDTITTPAQRPTAIATVPKSLSVRQVNFYNNGSLVKSVPLVF